jgi:hypothetical protein
LRPVRFQLANGRQRLLHQCPHGACVSAQDSRLSAHGADLYRLSHLERATRGHEHPVPHRSDRRSEELTILFANDRSDPLDKDSVIVLFLGPLGSGKDSVDGPPPQSAERMVIHTLLIGAPNREGLSEHEESMT